MNIRLIAAITGGEVLGATVDSEISYFCQLIAKHVIGYLNSLDLEDFKDASAYKIPLWKVFGNTYKSAASKIGYRHGLDPKGTPTIAWKVLTSISLILSNNVSIKNSSTPAASVFSSKQKAVIVPITGIHGANPRTTLEHEVRHAFDYVKGTFEAKLTHTNSWKSGSKDYLLDINEVKSFMQVIASNFSVALQKAAMISNYVLDEYRNSKDVQLAKSKAKQANIARQFINYALKNINTFCDAMLQRNYGDFGSNPDKEYDAIPLYRKVVFEGDLTPQEAEAGKYIVSYASNLLIDYRKTFRTSVKRRFTFNGDA